MATGLITWNRDNHHFFVPFSYCFLQFSLSFNTNAHAKSGEKRKKIGHVSKSKSKGNSTSYVVGEEKAQRHQCVHRQL